MSLARVVSVLVLLVAALFVSSVSAQQPCPYGKDQHGNCLEARLEHGEIKQAPQQIVIEADPITAKVSIAGGPQDQPTNQTLAKPLPAGTAILSFSAPGYAPKSYSAVIRGNGRQVFKAKLEKLNTLRLVPNVSCVAKIVNVAETSADKSKPPAHGAFTELPAPPYPTIEREVPLGGSDFALPAGRYRVTCSAKNRKPSPELEVRLPDESANPSVSRSLELEAVPISVSVQSDVANAPIFALYIGDSEQSVCPAGKSREELARIRTAPSFTTKTGKQAVNLPQGVGWYCFFLSLSSGTKDAKTGAPSQRVYVPEQGFDVSLAWRTHDPTTLSWPSSAEFARKIGECSARPSPEASATSPSATGCLEAAAWLYRSELEQSGPAREIKRLRQYIDRAADYFEQGQAARGDKPKPPANSLTLFQSACGLGSGVGCEAAAGLALDAKPVQQSLADALLSRGCALELNEPPVKASASSEVPNPWAGATSAPAEAGASELGPVNACFRRLDPADWPKTIELFHFNDLPEEQKNAPAWSIDKSDYMSLELFAAGNFFRSGGPSTFLAGASIISTTFMANSVFGASLRALSPMVVLYDEKNLTRNTTKRRGEFGVELADLEGRMCLGPVYLSGGFALEALYDTGTERPYLRYSGLSSTVGFQFAGWGLRGGFRMVELQTQRATVNGELLHGSGTAFLPYAVLETNLRIFDTKK